MISRQRGKLLVLFCLLLISNIFCSIIFNQFISFQFRSDLSITNLFGHQSSEKNNSTWPRPDKIAVLGVTAPPYMADLLTALYSKTFHFYLPLTIAAWRRLGYATFVIIIGSPKPWFSKSHYLNYVYETIDKKLPGSAKFHFIQTNTTKWVSHAKTAQMIRLFASELEPVRNLTDSYMVTADVDTLPLHDIYSLPNPSYTIRISIPKRRKFSPLGSNLTLGNSYFPLFCSFIEKKTISDQYRFSSIGMNIKTWQQLMDLKNNQSMNWAERIENVVENENLLAVNMTHFIDQNLISLKIYKWFKEHDKGNSFQVKK